MTEIGDVLMSNESHGGRSPYSSPTKWRCPSFHAVIYISIFVVDQHSYDCCNVDGEFAYEACLGFRRHLPSQLVSYRCINILFPNP